MKKKKRSFSLWVFILILLIPGAYFGSWFFFQLYIDTSARELLKLERDGMLSREYGYVWKQINASKKLEKNTAHLNGGHKFTGGMDSLPAARRIIDLPSLDAVAEFNRMSSFDRTIRINDRNGVQLAELKTVHTSVQLSQINEILLKSLLTTEDKQFYSRRRAYDYNALARSFLHAAYLSIRTLKSHIPRGCSTLEMQVARFLLMKYDSRGYAYTEKTAFRKLHELKLAQALGQVYTKKEILTFYINHCVSAGRGLVGYYDISTGLFGVPPGKLTIPQSLYLARLVKWNRQVPQKIIQQIKVNMPDLARSFRWNTEQQKKIIEQLDSLNFKPQSPVIGNNSYLIDYANEYLRVICRRKGMSNSALAEMDIADPESMIRRYGNATIQLTIDYRLQKLLEKAVAARGFAPDTTLRVDTLIGKKRSKVSRRITGQYYSYAIMDSKTHQMLAYCSTDKLGSRLGSLLINRNPNGSSVAKPLIYALAFDQEVYLPGDMASDDIEIPDTCPWARNYFYNKDHVPAGMTYKNVPEADGYQVRNHDWKFSGYDFLFNHLAQSNNIMAVETMYRLNTRLDDKIARSKRIAALIKRLGVRIISQSEAVTGPQIYASMVAVLRNSEWDSEKVAQNYSIALGTLELSLYEQLHMFNSLYDNSLVIAPSEHPSLFVKKIELSGEEVKINDEIKSVTLFDDFNKIAPVHLALHKRLISNPSDNLGKFDISNEGASIPANFAKSGTTDDVIKPFNFLNSDTSRTNYGLWNAVLRLSLTRNDLIGMIKRDTLLKDKTEFDFTAIPLKEELDVTLACIGECNTRYTGERDGKTLHGYISRMLLQTYGIPCSNGFYKKYEEELISKTPDRVRYAGSERSNLSFLSRAILKLQTGTGEKTTAADIRFEKSSIENKIVLKGKYLKKMLRFSLYMGDDSRTYRDLVLKLKKPLSFIEARTVVNTIVLLEKENQIVKRDLDNACGSLLQSIGEIEQKN